MEIVIQELERAVKYRKRELESFQSKLQLLKEQQEQYEQDLIPRMTQEVKDLESAILTLKLEEYPELKDLPF